MQRLEAAAELAAVDRRKSFGGAPPNKTEHQSVCAAVKLRSRNAGIAYDARFSSLTSLPNEGEIDTR
jgi:hypothetical protein